MEDVDDSNSATSTPAVKKPRRETSEEETSGASTSGVDGAASSNGSDHGTTVQRTASATTATTFNEAHANPLLPIKRKRGRPTKAESEARKAAQARGEQLPPKPPTYTPVATPVYTVGPDGVQRRRRGRPSKAEVAARKAAEAAAAAVAGVSSVIMPPAAALASAVVKTDT